ncbi:hypothetical protein [Algoriphagus winogradskyi]|uniref:Lipocalin-like domain-containing protein n=1 Tax=Algoriphagus winogradskyi TaxID=237017 RepID=A0ABY1NPR0_9BACT|nr:hypothetical protein [Algoriphagus winogradskyi]SMP15025.1 hypothetical protein SAMN06265367_102435 [Algoriphagus winogradskyi]
MILYFNRYKRGLPILFVLLFLFSYDSNSQDITGSWRWFEFEDRAFTIQLYKPELDDDVMGSYDLIGEHCGVYYNGGRMDCSYEEYSISLNRISENVFTGTILSAYSLAVSEIRITYFPSSKEIRWEVTKEGVGKNHLPNYFPLDVMMQ